MKDKIIFVAASSKGLGFGIARQAALQGAKVFIGSRDEVNVHQAIEKLTTETGADVAGSVLLASDGQSIETWINKGLSVFGSVHGLVCNAGGPPAGNFDNFDDKAWADAFELTLMSAVRMIRCVLPEMKKNKQGSILTITSSSVKEPINNLLLSNVMRSGVVSLAKSLSFELAAFGIRVNNLVPGRMDTDRVQYLDNHIANLKGISYTESRKLFENQIPMGRYGTTDEFGKAGCFLLSSSASYITGETLVVDGGSMRTVW